MNTLRSLLLLLALSAGSVHAASPSPASPEPKTGATSVVLLGDSLSAAHRMDDDAGWVALLERRLATATSTPPRIHNASRGGKTLTEGLAELPALLDAHRPDVVIIELGGNDAILGAPSGELLANLSSVIDLAGSTGATVVLLGFVIPPAFDKDGSADTLQAVYAQAAADKQVVLLPSLLAGISDEPTMLQDDNIHPNAAAQPRVLENAWPTLAPLLLN